MKKVLIGLIIIAAGAGIFFYLRSKQNPITENSNKNKELILGTWKVDSSHSVDLADSSDQSLIDSIYKSTIYTFKPNGQVAMTILQDKASASYEFITDSTILWTLHHKDSVVTYVKILQLDSSNLVIDANMGDPLVSAKLFLRKSE